MNKATYQLFFHAKQANLSGVLDAIADGANVHCYDNVLTHAIIGKTSVEVIQALIDVGADVHMNDDDALRTAVHKGQLDVFNTLIDAGANVHAKDNEALLTAAFEGHQAIFERLVEVGSYTPEDFQKALPSAMWNIQNRIVDICIAHGADMQLVEDGVIHNLFDSNAPGTVEQRSALIELYMGRPSTHYQVAQKLAGNNILANTKGLDIACQNGDVDTMRHIMTCTDKKHRPSLHNMSDYALRTAIQKDYYHVENFILTHDNYLADRLDFCRKHYSDNQIINVIQSLSQEQQQVLFDKHEVELTMLFVENGVAPPTVTNAPQYQEYDISM